MHNEIKPGSKVKIIGPSISNEAPHLIGTTAVISKETMGENFQIVGDTYYCFPKSSLELIQDFDFGDVVLITGPSTIGGTSRTGISFVISERLKHSEDNIVYSANSFPWYPESSLKLIHKATEKSIVVGSESYQGTDILDRLAKVEKWQYDHDHKQPINVVRLELTQDHGINEPALQKGEWVQVDNIAMQSYGRIFCIEDVKSYPGHVKNMGIWYLFEDLRLLSIEELTRKLNK